LHQLTIGTHEPINKLLSPGENGAAAANGAGKTTTIRQLFLATYGGEGQMHPISDAS
jgi:hypothetical protein